MTAEGAEAAAEHGVEEEELDAERDVVGSDAEGASSSPGGHRLDDGSSVSPGRGLLQSPTEAAPSYQAASEIKDAAGTSSSRVATRDVGAGSVTASTEHRRASVLRRQGRWCCWKSDGALIVDGSSFWSCWRQMSSPRPMPRQSRPARRPTRPRCTGRGAESVDTSAADGPAAQGRAACQARSCQSTATSRRYSAACAKPLGCDVAGGKRCCK